jgi:hypothetical protein
MQHMVWNELDEGLKKERPQFLASKEDQVLLNKLFIAMNSSKPKRRSSPPYGHPPQSIPYPFRGYFAPLSTDKS